MLKAQRFLAVDKTKQRDGSKRQTHCNGLSQGSLPEGQRQKSLRSSSKLVGSDEENNPDEENTYTFTPVLLL